MEVTPEAAKLCRDERLDIVRGRCGKPCARPWRARCRPMRFAGSSKTNSITSTDRAPGETIVTLAIETKRLTKSFGGSAGIFDLDLAVPTGASAPARRQRRGQIDDDHIADRLAAARLRLGHDPRPGLLA